jgi:hypothetical protein
MQVIIVPIIIHLNEEKMTKVLLAIIATLAILSLITGCSQATNTAPAQPTPTSSSAQGYPPAAPVPTTDPGYPAPANSQSNNPYPAPNGNGLQITGSNGQAKTVALADLNALAKSSVDSESGPKVSDVIKLGGITDFASLEFTGSNGSVTLTKDKITDQVILSLANNTITLVLGGTPKEQWIKDVSGIKAK